MCAEKVLIVGAGKAGVQCAFSLRDFGFTGEIHLIGDELALPYERPPLSKEFLEEDFCHGQLMIRDQKCYDESQVILRLSREVDSLDINESVVRFKDGNFEHFDKLVLATGARARKINAPWATASGIHYLRSFEDCERLKHAFARNQQRAVIIGGGYIGMEMASTLIKKGHEVTVLVREERILQQGSPEGISQVIAEAHLQAGVKLLVNTIFGEVITREGFVEAVTTEDGQRFEADVVILGIGAEPNDELLMAAGVCDHGQLAVDACMQVVPNKIYAIGDVSARAEPYSGLHMRVESIPNAMYMAKAAAAQIAGAPTPKVELPWFWTVQCGMRVQMAGIYRTEYRWIHRISESGLVLLGIDAESVVRCAQTIDNPGQFMLAKKVIEKGIKISDSQIQDTALSLKELLAA